MVLELSSGVYLHTAYAVSNIPNLFTEDDWSLDSQEGMRYVGTYTDGSPIDSTDPNDYIWAELLDTDVNDTDEEDVLPVADLQAQADALQDQIDILQSDASDLAVSIAQNADNISNGTNLASEANDIAKATGQHFWTDDSGAHVTEATQEEWNDPDSPNYQSGANSLWNSLGILFRRGLNNLLAILAGGADGTGEKGIAIYDGLGNALSNIVAKFTDAGSVIGRQDESHLQLDYHSMKMVDSEDNTYLHISDLRNEQGYIVETFEGDGSTDIFATIMDVNTLITATVDGTEVTAYAMPNYIQFASTPASGAIIEVTYEPVFAEIAKAYTLGQRGTGPIGVLSMVEGDNNVASGRRSHAEGAGNTVATDASDSHSEGVNNTIVIGTASHAEGADNHIEGSCAHAEGSGNQALTDFTHVEGEGNIAEGGWQHVFGRYNVADTSSYEIVGNGSNDNNRANIRTLSPTGKEWLNDTLEVSRDPVSAMEVATKQYVDNSGGGGGGTSDYTQLSNKPQVNGVTLTGNKSSSDLGITLGSLGGVPTTRTVNSKALSSDITLTASDVGALPDTTVIPTKVSDLTNDSGYIPKDDLFFKPGDVYTVSYNHARALTGYISSSTTGIYFEIPLPKFLTDVTSANITAMTGGVRGVGGYVNGLYNGSNLKSGFTVTASVDNPNTLYVSVVNGSALTNATNNTPISVALNSISITFS